MMDNYIVTAFRNTVRSILFFAVKLLFLYPITLILVQCKDQSPKLVVVISVDQMRADFLTKERPVIFHPLIPLLHIIFAGIDFLRGAFGYKTSQMVIELEKKEHNNL